MRFFAVHMNKKEAYAFVDENPQGYTLFLLYRKLLSWKVKNALRETPKACSSQFCFYQISCKKHTFSGIRKALSVVKNAALHIL